MSDSDSVPFRDVLNRVSEKVDTFAALVHQQLERSVNQQDGMQRLGDQKDDHENRLRVIEIHNAQSSIENKSTSKWVDLVLVIIVTSVITTGLNMVLNPRQEVSRAQVSSPAHISVP